MMPIRMRRKRRALEKVENLYRTARAQNDSINTFKQIRSRLRYLRRARAGVNLVGGPVSNRGALAGRARSQRDHDRRRNRRLDIFLSCRARPAPGAAVWAAVGVSRSCATARSNRSRCARPIGLQPLPEMSHFGAEFFRILRDSGGCLFSISKVLVFPAKLLAMQRAAP